MGKSFLLESFVHQVDTTNFLHLLRCIDKEDIMSEAKQTIDGNKKKTLFPGINFSTFLFSLNSSALYHLGEVEDPGTGKKIVNLTLAKQTIDVIGMLQEKTMGNLSLEEASLIKNILHDLRIMYVNAKGK